MFLIEKTLFFLLLLFLPTQLGKHFWPSFSFILGQRIDYLSPTLYVTDILIFLLFSTWVIIHIQPLSLIKQARSFHSFSKRFFLRMDWARVVVTLVVLFLIFDISLSQSPQEGLYGLLKLFEIGFLTYYTSNILRMNLKIVLFPLTFGIISESVLATAQFFAQGSLGGILYYVGERTFTSVTPGIANTSINGQLLLRPYGTFPHPNVLAGYLVIGMTLLGALFVENSAWLKKLLIIFTLLLGTIGLCLTLSRVAILVWLFVCAFLLIRYFQEKIFTKKTLLVIYGLLGIFVIVLFVVSPLVPRFSQVTLQDESVVLREQLATDALRMLFAHPVFGVGLHNFLVALPHYDFSRGSVFSIQPVHNIFLLIGAETGFVGLWVYVSFIVWLYIQLFKQHRLSGGNSLKLSPTLCIILLTEVMLLGSFDHYFFTVQQGQILMGLVLGTCMASLSLSSPFRHASHDEENKRIMYSD